MGKLGNLGRRGVYERHCRVYGVRLYKFGYREIETSVVIRHEELERNTIHMDVYINRKILLRDWFEKERGSK